MTAAIWEGVDKQCKQLVREFGFATNPQLHPMVNAATYLGQMSARLYSKQIKNRRSHNLCKSLQPPFDYNDLIGLGLKFCPNVAPPTRTLNTSLQRFSRNIRLRDWATKAKEVSRQNTSTQDNYEPKIYLRSD